MRGAARPPFSPLPSWGDARAAREWPAKPTQVGSTPTLPSMWSWCNGQHARLPPWKREFESLRPHVVVVSTGQHAGLPSRKYGFKSRRPHRHCRYEAAAYYWIRQADLGLRVYSCHIGSSAMSAREPAEQSLGMNLRNLIVICHSPASEGVSVDTSRSSGEGRGDESRRDAAIWIAQQAPRPRAPVSGRDRRPQSSRAAAAASRNHVTLRAEATTCCAG